MNTMVQATRRERYQTDGFLEQSGLFSSADVEALRAASDRVWASIDLSKPAASVHWRDHAEHGRVADRLDPASGHSAYFAEICASRTLHDIVETLLDGPAFVLKDKLIMKRPGTAGYGLHQDMPYWEGVGLNADDALSAAIALDDVTPAHGPIELHRGLHLDRLAGPEDNPLDADPRLVEGREPYRAMLKAGDVLFFHPLAPHASAPNTADTPRRVYMITFARDTGDARGMIERYRGAVKEAHRVHRRDTC